MSTLDNIKNNQKGKCINNFPTDFIIHGDKMSERYSKDKINEIIALLFEFCDKLPRVNCKAYKLALGQQVTVELFNNLLYTIGGYKSGNSILKEDMIAAVCTPDGKSGLLFSYEGVYYREGWLYGGEHSFTYYEYCNTAESIRGLANNDMFNVEMINCFFGAITMVFKLYDLKASEFALKERKLIKENPEYFTSGSEIIDKIVEEYKILDTERYGEKIDKLSFFKFAEKKKLKKEWTEHLDKISELIESRNCSGGFDDNIEAVICEIIRLSLEQRYFIKAVLKQSDIDTDPCSMDVTLKYVEKEYRIFPEKNQLVAIVDLREFDSEVRMIVFEKRVMRMLIKSKKTGESYYRTIYYDSKSCYCSVMGDIESYVDVYNLNYVLDKVHNATVREFKE